MTYRVLSRRFQRVTRQRSASPAEAPGGLSWEGVT